MQGTLKGLFNMGRETLLRVRRFIKAFLLRTFLGEYVEAGIFPTLWGLLLANWFCQRVLRFHRGAPCLVHFTSQVTAPRNLVVGRGVWKSLFLSGNCYIQAGNGVQIGDDTIFAPGVRIVSANHDPYDLRHWLPGPSVQIGSRCWLGANAVILPGVKIGDGAVVGAGAVVSCDVPPRSVVVGNPARVFRYLDREAPGV